MNKSKLTPDPEALHYLDVFISEMTGIGTNKTRGKLDRELELSIIEQFPLAPNLKRKMPRDLHDTDVAVPQCVKEALNEAIEKGVFPLEKTFVLWMEKKVAEFNGINPECICAHPQIDQKGKLWDYYPEVADRFTGFTYYPQD
jgi:hypothetical protein